MPFIEVKTNVKLTDDLKNILKGNLNMAISYLAKPASYLMINIVDNQDMMFAKSDEPCAYIEVKTLGDPSKDLKDKFTLHISESVSEIIKVPTSRIYVSYFYTDSWGLEKSNF